MIHAGLSSKKITASVQQDLIDLVELLWERKPLSETIFQDIFYTLFKTIPNDPMEWIAALRAFYLLSMAIATYPELENFKKPLQEWMQKVKTERACPRLQLAEAYEHLIKNELKIPLIKVPPILNASGAAPFEPEGHWSWGQITMGHYHPELGVLWLLLGQKTNDPSFLKAALQMGVWELSTSKHDFSPFPALFCCEMDYDPEKLIAWRTLFFRFLWNHTGDEKYREPCHWSEALLARQRVRDPLIHYLERKGKSCENETVEKRETIPSPSLLQHKDPGVYGWRDPDLSLYFTTSGGGTSLGSMTYKSIEIVAYGPHSYPLNEAIGFGVSTMPRGATTFEASPWEERELSLRGVCRLSGVDVQAEKNLPWNHFREGPPSTAWLDVLQTLKGNKVEIDTKLLQFEPSDRELAFTFFVKASAVKMDEMAAIPNQLRHFTVEVSSLEIVSENCTIRLFQYVDNIPLHKYSVEVIPLGGNRAFWGADFLISFLYKNTELRNRWILELA